MWCLFDNRRLLSYFCLPVGPMRCPRRRSLENTEELSANRMGTIGVGVIILCIVWVTAILVCVVLMRFEGPVTYLRLAILTIALLLTAALWIKYTNDMQERERERESELKRDRVVVYDYSIIGRVAVLTVTGTGLLVGLLSVFMFHVTVPRRAARLPPWSSVFQ